MLSYNSKQRAILFIASIVSASLFFAFLILSGHAQQEVSGTTLLKEYFLPIQALGPIESGAITVNGNECAVAGSEECVGHDVDATLGYGTDIDSTLGYKKSTEGLMLENNGTVTYKVTVTDPSTYQLRLTAKNAIDSLDGITRSQYEIIASEVGSIYSGSATEEELSFRHLRFEVAINKEGQAGAVPSLLNIVDRNDFSSDSIDLGALQPGSYTVTLTYLNDLEIAYPNDSNSDTPDIGDACSETTKTCSNFTLCAKNINDTSVCALPASDNGDGILKKTPIIKEIKLSKTTFTNDVMGVRVYTNPEHLSALDWYYQKLNNPGNAVPFAVDGYRGVLDGRTAYINAANIDNNGVFYTNIYVIAYNINASPATVQIYNQVLNNWQFNVNLSEGLNELEKDRVKNQLRRDTFRLEDANVIRATLESYKLRNGKYPDLKAGTFVPGHVLSTWPTWQTILGTQLSTSLPVDPINQLAIETYPQGTSIASEPRQFDCTNEADKNFCQTICTRSKEGNQALTGCKADQQCVDNQYCSLVPPGYDPVTGWNQTTQKLAFTDVAVTGNPVTKFGLYGEGSINTNGDLTDQSGPFSKYKDDAFIYQYTAVNGGESYVFNYRLEFSATCTTKDSSGKCVEFTAARCSNNQCYFEPGEICVDSGTSLYSLGADFSSFRNQYCFAGLFVNSCGNGIVQMDAGEQCEPTVAGTNSNYCDATYGLHAWYNKSSVNPGCTSSCQTVTNANVGSLPVPYNPQQPALSCGGYCGDNLIQFENNEQCDQGGAGGVIPRPNRGGSGGVGPDAQYVCAGNQNQGTGTDIFFNNTAQALTINASNPSPVKTTSSIVAMPANTTFTVQYNVADSINPAPDADRLDVLLEELSVNGTLIVAHTKSFAIKNITSDDRKLTFTTRPNTTQARLTFSFSSQVPSVTATISGILATTGVTNVVLGNTASNVNSCTSYGGYCGDSTVQNIYGEECDIANYEQPKPEQTANQIKNGGFEQGMSNWLAIQADGTPKKVCTDPNVINTCSLDLSQPTEVTFENRTTANIQSGSQSLVFNPTNVIRAVGQKVLYAGGSAVTMNVMAKRITSGPSPVLKFRLYQYDYVNFVAVPFSNGAFLEVNLTAGTTDVTGVYQKFSGTITLPTAANNNLNNATLAEIYVVGGGTVYFDLATLSSNYKLQYSCGSKNNQSCQMIGGSCGDAILQASFGESCDNGSLNGVNGATVTGSGADRTIAGTPSVAIKVTTTASGATYDQNGDGKADGSITAGKAYSYCTAQCSQPFCGDGIKGIDGATGIPELCDSSDPIDPMRNFCTNSCNQFKLGGICAKDSQCIGGTVCATNAQKTCVLQATGKRGVCVDNTTCTSPSTCEASVKSCVLLPGQRGCTEDIDCLNGLECNPLRHMCMVPLDLYLKHHNDPKGFPKDFANLNPKPCPNGTNAECGGTLQCDVSSHKCYDPATLAFRCPYTSIVSRIDIPVVLDGCTGLEFRNLDLPINTKVSHAQAVDSCQSAGLGFTLPAAKELYALVSPITYTDINGDGSSAKAPNNYLKLCSLNGLVSSKGGDDSCFEGNATENYLYWTDTKYDGKKACAQTSTTTCIQDSDCPNLIVNGQPTTGHESCSLNLYYAVNFKKGTLEVYPENTLMRSRCTSSTSCGNGSIEGDEECEFNAQGEELLNGASCQEKGFVGGNTHCDPTSCRLRFDNCMVITQPKSSPTATDAVTCEAACNEIGQTLQISQCSAPRAGTLAQGCTINGDCTGLCENNTCTNNPNLSCTVNNDCNFGSCALQTISANASGLITQSGADNFPVPIGELIDDEYSVDFTSLVTALPTTGTTTCNAVAGSVDGASEGTCDLKIFPDTNQVVTNTIFPSALCTCTIPNPTYYSNNLISITNETTQGILALDALENFKSAVSLLNTATIPSDVNSWSDENFISYISAQSFVSSLDPDYPANVLNPNANTNDGLKTKILAALASNTASYAQSAQSLQNLLNTYASNLANLANSSAPALVVAETTTFRKILTSLVGSVKRLFGRGVEAQSTPLTPAEKLERAQTAADLLPPRKAKIAIDRPSLIAAYQAPSATWPLLNNETQLLALKYHLYSILTEADLKIQRSKIAVDFTAAGSNASQMVIKELNDQAKDLRDSVTSAASTSTYYIENTTTRNTIIAAIDTLLTLIRDYPVTIDCPEPETSTDSYDWTSVTTNGTFQVQYNGSEWKTISGVNASDQTTTLNTSTVNSDYQCRYKCATGVETSPAEVDANGVQTSPAVIESFHAFGDLCISNSCQLPIDLPVGQVNSVANSGPQPIVEFGSTAVTGDTTLWNYNQGAASLNTCEWKCPTGSFKDPSQNNNVCLSECTNLCSVHLSDTLKADVQTAIDAHPGEGGQILITACATDAQAVGCGIGSNNQVATDYICPSSMKKVATGCMQCPSGEHGYIDAFGVGQCASNSCGITPTGGVTLGSLNTTGSSSTWSYVASAPGECQWTCNAGYYQSGNSCKALCTNICPAAVSYSALFMYTRNYTKSAACSLTSTATTCNATTVNTGWVCKAGFKNVGGTCWLSPTISETDPICTRTSSTNCSSGTGKRLWYDQATGNQYCRNKYLYSGYVAHITSEVVTNGSSNCKTVASPRFCKYSSSGWDCDYASKCNADSGIGTIWCGL